MKSMSADVLSMMLPVHLEKHGRLSVLSCCANNVAACVPTVHNTRNNRRTDRDPWTYLHSSAPTSIAIGPGITE